MISVIGLALLIAMLLLLRLSKIDGSQIYREMADDYTPLERTHLRSAEQAWQDKCRADRTAFDRPPPERKLK